MSFYKLYSSSWKKVFAPGFQNRAARYLLNWYFPTTLGIELVRGCNFRCTMCPISAHNYGKKDHIQYMKLDLLNKITREIERNPTINTIWLFHFGEPLLHPRFKECLEILNKSEIARSSLVIMHTNASLLSDEKAQAIIDIPIIKKIVFSFDGYGDEASYKILRGDNYHKVMNNIINFSRLARKYRPELKMATCTILPRFGEIPGLNVLSNDIALQNLARLFVPFGIDVEIRNMHSYSGHDDLKISGIRKSEIFGGCPHIEKDELYITVSGKIQPCCNIYDDAMNIGNINNKHLLNLINNKKMGKIRHFTRLDDRDQLNFCKFCDVSLGALLSKEELKEFWEFKHLQKAIINNEEYKHIFQDILNQDAPLARGVIL